VEDTKQFMAKVKKQQAITILRRCIRQIAPLKKMDRNSMAFSKWRRDTKVALRTIFGNDSQNVKDFISITFLNPNSPTSIEEDHRNGLNESEVILQAILEELQDDWPDEEAVKPEQSDSSVEINKHSSTRNITAPDNRKVFVVHGRNLPARDAMFRFLRSIGLKPLEWSQAVKETGKASPYIGEILDAAFAKAQAVLVLMTPDDKARVRKRFILPEDSSSEIELTHQARPNVLFEAGMAMGRNSDRTILVELGNLRPFSDIGGRHVLRLNDSSPKRQQLAERLASAGCPVDLSGTDWHTEGNFSF
jgi:Predicted nucleotide-binding protein containing TIR -like domain